MMKKLQLHSLTSIALLAIMAFVLVSSAFAKELPDIRSKSIGNNSPKNAVIAPYSKSKVTQTPKALSIDFAIVDSLANAYSFYTNGQKPFVYEPTTGTLAMIKRGFYDKANYPLYSGKDLKDNILIRTSTDLGATWNAPVLVFDYTVDGNGDQVARYPSLFAFPQGNNLYFIYSTPISENEGWNGFYDGFYDPAGGYYVVNYAKSFTSDGVAYNWAGTDSRLLGKVVSGDLLGIAVGRSNPQTTTAYQYYPAIPIRKSTDYSDAWATTIPTQWAYNKFKNPDTSSYTSDICDFVIAGDKMYMGIMGAFSSYPDKASVGVSVSEDNGNTWSDFDQCPFSLVRDYVSAQGYNPDSCFVTYSNHGFTALDNGDCYFAMTVVDDYKDLVEQNYLNVLYDIVEIKRESGVWSISKISDYTGSSLTYYNDDGTRTTQIYNELQLSRTVDGSAILCKWTDFDSVSTEPDDEGNYYLFNYEVYVATRFIGNNTWGYRKNLTNNGAEQDRLTWIPDLLPNNLLNIPMIKLMAIPNAEDTESEAVVRQLTLGTNEQYVMVGHFDGTPVFTGVEETTNNVSLTISSIYPNPADSKVEILFNSNQNGTATLELFNAMGQKVAQIFNGNAQIGTQGFTYSSSSLSNGSYYCVLTINGQKVTKMLNVVH